MQSEPVSVVIVNYNTRELLDQAIGNLEGSYDPLEIIVVDNNSTDGSAGMVKEKYPRVKLEAQDKNTGLAQGNNAGLKLTGGKYVLFMGSDAFPKAGAIKILADYMQEHPDVGISVGRVVLRNGQPDRDTHRGLPTPWVALTHFSGLENIWPKSRIFGGYYRQYQDPEQIHQIELVTSHFMFARREMLNRVGEWDENFFVYGEDVDLCWRVKQAGWRVMYIPTAKVVHYKGASVGIRRETADITRASPETRKKMMRETTEAMAKFYGKHFAGSPEAGLVLVGIKLLAKLRSIKLPTINP